MIEWIVLTLPHAQWKWKFPFIIFWWLPWEVDGGEDHHAGDVDGVDKVELLLSSDVVGGLIDDIHEDSRHVGHHDNVEQFPAQGDGDLDGPALSPSEVGHLAPPPPHDVLLDGGGAVVVQPREVQGRQQVVGPLNPELEAALLSSLSGMYRAE